MQERTSVRLRGHNKSLAASGDSVFSKLAGRGGGCSDLRRCVNSNFRRFVF